VIEAICWAWRQTIEADAKIVLLSIAEDSDESRQYLLSPDSLGRRAILDEKSVLRALDTLVSLGLLSKDAEYVYRLNLDVEI